MTHRSLYHACALFARRTAWTLWIVLSAPLLAAGAEAAPAALAASDSWPEPLGDRAAFDRASRAELLDFVPTLEALQSMSDAAMRAALGIKDIQHASVERWLEREWSMLVRNYQLASGTCTAIDWTCAPPASTAAELRLDAKQMLARMPAEFQSWREQFEFFSRGYAIEQLKLAALTPAITSEIETFGDHEWNGDLLPDRLFYLTLDDGPTEPGGHTDDVLSMLQAEGRSALFFVLGSKLNARFLETGAASVQALYGQNCVASHGWEHRSHASWDQWQVSVQRTQRLIAALMPAAESLALFRPPFGERRPDSAAFIREQGLHIALWNLDSRDWSSRLSASDTAQRLISLMLLKRHGVVLFHDTQSKAQDALPVIFHRFGAAVQWGDCHALASR